MITLHHLENSRSQRVLWLLEELEVPYELRRYERDKTTMLAPASLRAVHPLGKSPVITDDNKTIAETGAIVEYLLRAYGNGRLAPAPESEAWLDYIYWLHFAEGSAMPPLVMTLLFEEVGKRAPFLIRPVARAIGAQVRSAYLGPMLTSQLDFMDAALAKTGWFAGDFSAADVMMSFPIETAAARAGLGKHTRLIEFLNRIHARPAYQRALAAGGPYAYADDHPA